MDAPEEATAVLRNVQWRLSYRTSALKPDGCPVDILHDFNLPALRRAVRYDRVAGYFRSSSLAAASQRFSAFVGHQGTMRLIVGADLEPQDAQVIVTGTEERLTAALNATLEHPDPWPEAVTSGVTLLAWMVAHGCLEVRVAFRVHAQTGQPLPIDSREDGYVHMKWAVFADACGNRLYASGSLNESRTALLLNADLAGPRIEAVNEVAGHSQAMLDYLVIRGIIRSRQKTGGTESLFWREIAALEDIMQE
jgi:hypothetical protein